VARIYRATDGAPLLVEELVRHEASAALGACAGARLVHEDGAGHRFHHVLVDADA
jgi:hypothetical protein